MNGQLYTMDFFTNLHVGGLGDNLSVVDKQVQRDPITEYPYIQASSLKGAIRAHAEALGMEGDTIGAIFGKDGVPGKSSSTTQGLVSFLPANLLLLPLRANHCAYLQATCPAILEQLRTTCVLLGKGDSALANLCTQLLTLYAQNKDKDMLQTALLIGKVPDCTPEALRVEGMKVKQVQVAEPPKFSLLQSGLNQLLLLSDAAMKSVANALPVLAHNRLENGISKTLWYEEVVPRKTVMYTAMLSSNEDHLTALAAVCDTTKEAQPVVQFGANATLGYGLCKMQKKL